VLLLISPSAPSPSASCPPSQTCVNYHTLNPSFLDVVPVPLSPGPRTVTIRIVHVKVKNFRGGEPPPLVSLDPELYDLYGTATLELWKGGLIVPSGTLTLPVQPTKAAPTRAPPCACERARERSERKEGVLFCGRSGGCRSVAHAAHMLGRTHACLHAAPPS
jgi:hypothetical protein